MANNKPKIALLFGGTSPERKVSKASGASIYAALKNLGYDTRLINPAYGKKQPDVFFNENESDEISNRNYVEAINSELLDGIDLAFLALHGKWGEDGTVQSLLELRGIKYTGSNVVSSSVAMDKAMSKIIFQYYGVKTPNWFVVSQSNSASPQVVSTIKEKFGFPCVIKPNDQGSTVGLTICDNENKVEESLSLAYRFSDKALIEEYIPGREMTVTVFDNKALPVLEMKPKHGLYDYECKYTPGMTEYEVPAKISKQVEEELQFQALLAFNSLGCRGYSRIDFRLKNDKETYCLEVNTLPGMTSTSLVPKAAKAVGISFEELVDRIVKLSL
jgi:D-alanine-D-alanine ligase